MSRCSSLCQCTLTFKIFLVASILYLVISVSLMIPSIKEYKGFEEIKNKLESTEASAYDCWEICEPIYSHKNGESCCVDTLGKNCESKQACKDEKIKNMQNGMDSAQFDIEIGGVVTLFFLLMLMLVYRRKYSYFVGRQTAFRQGIPEDFENGEESINKSLLFSAKGSVYKSFVEEQAGKSEEVCTICYQDYAGEKKIMLNCRHDFHAECIREWLDKKSDCPVCRASA